MNIVLPFIIALGSCFLLTPIVIKLAYKFHVVDDPKKRSHPATLHKIPIARAGGLPLFLAFLVAAVVALPFSQKLLGIILGGLVVTVVGLLDDKFDLDKKYKIGGQVLAALIVVASGIGINFITNPLYILSGADSVLPSVIRLDSLRVFFDFFGTHSIVVWADLFAIFWIVWVINMVNFSSGVDGQLPGFVAISAFFLFA